MDVLTGRRFNIWGKANDDMNYHTDWSPLTNADLDIIKAIIKEAKISGNQLWRGRSGVLTVVVDGVKHNIAVGFHLYSHDGALSGGVNAQTGPEWRHFCMYYGDSDGGTNGLNEAAENVYNMTR